MSARCYRGSTRVDAPSAAHRGIAYGDGVFETMRVHDGGVPWWTLHWARLAQGALRLSIALPDHDVVQAEIKALLQDVPAGVLKLILSRGAGGRGYAPQPEAPSAWQLSRHALPEAPTRGLVVRWCETTLSRQPLLAGIKHCNRLEQVLARAEWQRAGRVESEADEGLMCDEAGNVVSGIACNLFLLREGVWQTPLLDHCGVAGVCRRWAIEALGAREVRVCREALISAEAVFLCNAVRGILPVSRLEERAWAPSAAIAQAQQALAAAHPAFRLSSAMNQEFS